MSNRYDAIVIGAGIHGAGCAQALAAAGHSCLVLEQAAGPATGTSSRSSKLIHGGLRYLESRQLNLVRECLRERTLLLRNAPELVQLVPFYLPVYRSASRSTAKIKLGLHLYHLIAGDAPGSEYHSLPESEWEQLDGLNTEGLQRVYQYFDAQTDDKALTRAVLRSARSLGAVTAYDSRVEQIELLSEGVRVNYLQQTTPTSVEAAVVVNAAGPWVNRVLGNVTPTQPPCPIELVQGAHLLLPDMALRGVYYLEALSDRRGVFVMPWQQQTLIGTTETAFSGDPAVVEPTTEEIDYLLATARHHFPDAPFYRNELTGQFAGLRVLPAGEGAFFSRPREAQMPTDREQQPRLLSLVGGKLTNYRATAEKCVARLAESLPARKAAAQTSELALSLST